MLGRRDELVAAYGNVLCEEACSIDALGAAQDHEPASAKFILCRRALQLCLGPSGIFLPAPGWHHELQCCARNGLECLRVNHDAAAIAAQCRVAVLQTRVEA